MTVTKNFPVVAEPKPVSITVVLSPMEWEDLLVLAHVSDADIMSVVQSSEYTNKYAGIKKTLYLQALLARLRSAK